MAAIISLDDRRIVFVEDNELAQPREVVVGLVQGAEVQVLSGLEAGDRLIVTGQRDVRPGHGVAVREVIRGSEPFLPAPPREIGL